jgi:hypothetical protein
VSTKIFAPSPPDAASDPAYINLLRAASNEAKVGQVFSEQLWDQYHPHADEHFLTEIRRNFNARFWEMYLTCALLQYGPELSVLRRKPGPDILIEHEGRRIWIEAVVVTDGEPGKPDSISPPALVRAPTAPDEKIILRYRTAIDEKHRKLQSYLSKGIVSAEDSYIVAVNGYALSYRWEDAEMPRILKAVFPLGALQFLFDRDTGRLTGSRHQFRPNIYKGSGAGVSTEVFVNDHYDGISGVMHSYANACMTARPLGVDFLLIHNPRAANRVPHKLIRSTREYFATPVDGGYTLECHQEP